MGNSSIGKRNCVTFLCAITAIKSMATNINPNIATIDENCLFYFRRNTRPEISRRLNWVMPSTIQAALSIAANVEQEESEGSSKVKPKKITKADSICLVESEETKKIDSDYQNRFRQLNDKITSLSNTVNSLKYSKIPDSKPQCDQNLQSVVSTLKDMKDSLCKREKIESSQNHKNRVTSL